MPDDAPIPPRLAAPEAGTGTPPPLAGLGLITVFALLSLAIHLVTLAITPYGIHRDELLYLAMGKHLQLWRMGFPPAIAVLTWAARGIFGDTLFAVRLFPALAGALLTALTGLIARELGGGRAAQALAMLAVCLGPLFLHTAALCQPVVLDQLCWTLGFLALIRLGQRRNGSGWWLLGLAGGLGLLTKFSIGFFAVGVGVALVISPQRASLASRWPWLALLTAAVIGSATLVGQFRLGFPVIRDMHDLQAQQLYRVTVGGFLRGQVEMLGPAFLLAVLGLIGLLMGKSMRPYRTVGWTCLVTFLVLLGLHGKAYYIGPIYPMLLAAGTATTDSLAHNWRRAVRLSLTILILSFDAVAMPFGLPILPPSQMARFAGGSGLKDAVTSNRGVVLALPQDYADMLGWEDLTGAVAETWRKLPLDQQGQAVLLARNYGEAGALEFFGPRIGLVQPIVELDHSLLWPLPTGRLHGPVIAVGYSPEELRSYFRVVELARYFDHPWMVPEERNLPICVAKEPHPRSPGP
ncbi:MAG: glycosyltransferase family 39 protein [Verrucomicrobia bacterium]|nr:glycosyltransferase family 39 protein [Verrucomicrobiota bacterium]